MRVCLKFILFFCALFISLYTTAQDKGTLDLLVSKGMISRQEADELAKQAVGLI